MKPVIFASLLLSAALPCTSCMAYPANESDAQFMQSDRYFKEYEGPQYKYFDKCDYFYPKLLLLVDLIENASNPAQKCAFQAQLKADTLLILNVLDLKAKQLEKKLLKAQEKLSSNETDEDEKEADFLETRFSSQETYSISRAIGSNDPTSLGTGLDVSKTEKQNKKIQKKQENLAALQFFKETLLDLLKYTR